MSTIKSKAAFFRVAEGKTVRATYATDGTPTQVLNGKIRHPTVREFQFYPHGGPRNAPPARIDRSVCAIEDGQLVRKMRREGQWVVVRYSIIEEEQQP